MSEKRRGLGRGLGALIPSSAATNGSGNGGTVSRPVDLFFPEGRKKIESVEQPAAEAPAKTQDKEATAPGQRTAAGNAAAATTAPDKDGAGRKSASSSPEVPAKKTAAGKTSAASSNESPESSPAAETSAVPAVVDSPAEDGPVPAETAGADFREESGVELVEVPGAPLCGNPGVRHPSEPQAAPKCLR